jgi:hypothetical protein
VKETTWHLRRHRKEKKKQLYSQREKRKELSCSQKGKGLAQRRRILSKDRQMAMDQNHSLVQDQELDHRKAREKALLHHRRKIDLVLHSQKEMELEHLGYRTEKVREQSRHQTGKDSPQPQSRQTRVQQIFHMELV